MQFIFLFNLFSQFLVFEEETEKTTKINFFNSKYCVFLPSKVAKKFFYFQRLKSSLQSLMNNKLKYKYILVAQQYNTTAYRNSNKFRDQNKFSL